MGRLKHEALREEVHRFDDLKIPEAAPTASAQIAVQPCALLQRNIDPLLIFSAIIFETQLSRCWARNRERIRSPWRRTFHTVSVSNPVQPIDRG